MLSSKAKDLKTRQLLLEVENSKLIHKFIFRSYLNNPLFKKRKNIFLFKYLKKFSNIKIKASTRVLNKCVLSNRNQKTFSHFRTSRLVTKDLLSFGLIPGYKKAVW